MKHKMNTGFSAPLAADDIIVTNFWGIDEVCKVYKTDNSTALDLIRLESIRAKTFVKKDYCSALLRHEDLNRFHWRPIHRSYWYNVGEAPNVEHVMGVNFDGFRRQTISAFNDLVEKLNRNISYGSVEVESVDIQQHMDDLRDNMVTLICLMREGEFDYLPLDIAIFNPEGEED